MKKTWVLLLALVMTASISACSKQPAEEIGAAKTAVDSAVSEGAEKYAAEEYKALQTALNAAMDEVKAQEGKMFGKYDKAKELLAQVKTSAEQVKGKAVAAREEFRTAASAAKDTAAAALVEVQGLLAVAPVGKGSEADLEAMRADVAGLETTLAEVQPMIDGGDFVAAKEKAEGVIAKIAAITAEIQAAQSKMAAPIEQKK